VTGNKHISFCISRNIPSSATDASNTAEPVTGTELKPEASVCAQSSSEPPEKKKRITNDEQDTSHAEEDICVLLKTQGPTAESQSSRLNKKYEISLLDEKYVLFVH
jgi:hypothetical protein